jgi:AraC-like DNA-binding protein
LIFKKHIPAYPLSQYIQHILYINGPQSVPYLIELPDPKLNLVIELENDSVNTLYTDSGLKNERTMKHGWVSGSNAQAIVYKNNRESAIVSIRFTVGGFYALTKIPMSEIIYPGLEIDLLLGNSVNKLYQLLINEKDIDKIFEYIERYFVNYIADNNFENSLVKFIDKHIDKPIDWLVHKSGYSHKHVIQVIKKQTGFSLKYLQRLHRFRKVLDAIQQQGHNISWTSITYDHGYFDQAHFIKEFVHFTGFTPSQYFSLHTASDHNKIFTDIKLIGER